MLVPTVPSRCNRSMRIEPIQRVCREAANRLIRTVDDALMPVRCVFCGTRTLPGEQAICDGCRGDLPWLENPYSPAPPPIATMVALLAYEFPVDSALKALKFRRKLYYAPAFGDLLCDALGLVPGDIDALLPVPLHWRRLTFRGFNQALEIGRRIARRHDLPVITDVVRRRATRAQSGLSAAKRRRNVRNAFVVRRTLPCSHVLVVDDVVTTGATTRQLATMLLQNGVEKVSVLAVARASVLSRALSD